ncbi:sodium:proton antiporter [uncultured Bacteroides sp.]|uniref:sodium:proton antiporter n=1 Tax=uncultured Bacteroides sp. TaxID=162156 RepID=UPI0025E70848|nr:sodium:proton antiporter [uncultured Bacteroides sp.]
MRKVLSFSAFLVVGLFVAQYLPAWSGNDYGTVKTVSNVLLYICLGFIMINVGREFEVDKSRWQTYAKDYFVAMATAAMPWFLIAIYYIFILLPPEYWNSWEAWKENLLLSRFAAPTSAGILFTMLAAIGLKSSWIYKKIQVLAIFDDLDTILLMIPLQIMMIGPRWQLLVIIFIVFLLLSFGWKKLSKYNMRQDWKAILFYSVLVFAATQSLYLITKNLYGEEASIHIEVLLPAFVLGMVMKHKEIDTAWERKASTGISFIFMFLVGMSMPPLQGISLSGDAAGMVSVTGSQEMMPWVLIIIHVIMVSLLSNVGKLFPVFFYRDRKLSERLALSIGMFTRGEVGAGVIFIALGYNLGGPALVISVLTIVLNLILTGIFVLWVKKLALMSYKE